MAEETDLGPVERTLKPMLAECIREAVHLALIDSVLPEQNPEGETFEERAGLWTPEQRRAMEADVYAIPDQAMAQMDPGALAKNIANRLLGTGGWTLPNPRPDKPPIYTGNATTREVFDASFNRPDRSHVDEIAFDFLRAMDAAAENESDA